MRKPAANRRCSTRLWRKPVSWGKTTADCTTVARWQDGKGWVQATQKFPYCYPDAKVYSATALEQGN